LSQKVKLTGWMLIMSKLAEIQMESTLTAADELEEKQAHVEKLTQQIDKLNIVHCYSSPWKEVVFVCWFDQFVVWCDQWRLEWAGVAQMSFCYRCNMNE
jgi:hypothetical protein